MDIRGVNYYWKDPTKGANLQAGVIAQEVERSFPGGREHRKGRNQNDKLRFLCATPDRSLKSTAERNRCSENRVVRYQEVGSGIVRGNKELTWKETVSPLTKSITEVWL